MRDIERVSNAHDFMWTKQELSDMIHCFDSDRDGKVRSCCSLISLSLSPVNMNK